MFKIIVNAWFENYVNSNIKISQDTIIAAKNSCDWLTSEIKSFSNNLNSFPDLWGSNDFYLKMGSYARKTQFKPLNDVDIMIIFSAQGSLSNFNNSIWNDIDIFPNEKSTQLTSLIGESGTLSSIRMINLIRSELKKINQYKKSEIKRNMQALRLELSSYDWGFDIVPSFKTVENELGQSFYLIPNGYGKWERTNPMLDRNDIDEHQKVINIDLKRVIRILKYWNYRSGIYNYIPSYVLETMILDFIDSPMFNVSEENNYRIFINKFMDYMLTYCRYEVYDRKRIQGVINYINNDDINYLLKSLNNFKNISNKAIWLESIDSNEMAINLWKDFFN
ncbi:hypothetical protein [Lactobacillus sp. Sy-1]|uniref:hypothetical protein n=1 Tax=Lactobacillus sp. Sy-1 TaxID=2109645 RepID=UPI001C5AA66D|nr:hypothetical protein [Lactobacillus sp. Sy-1]MBW1606071.1 hypothetical protein [Lactobacillus sp. Sy-1]